MVATQHFFWKYYELAGGPEQALALSEGEKLPCVTNKEISRDAMGLGPD